MLLALPLQWSVKLGRLKMCYVHVDPAVPVVRNNPAAPRGRRGALPRVRGQPAVTPHDITPMSNRKQKSLLRMADDPGMGCSRCRHSPNGCETCERTRRGWRVVHNREALP